MSRPTGQFQRRRGAVQPGRPGPYGEFLRGQALSAQDPRARQLWSQQPQSRAARGLGPVRSSKPKLEMCDVDPEDCPVGPGRCHIARLQGGDVCTTNPGAKMWRRGAGSQCQGVDQQECDELEAQGICTSVYNPNIGRSYCRTKTNIGSAGGMFLSACTDLGEGQCANEQGCQWYPETTYYKPSIDRNVTRRGFCKAGPGQALNVGPARSYEGYGYGGKGQGYGMGMGMPTAGKLGGSVRGGGARATSGRGRVVGGTRAGSARGQTRRYY